MAKCKYRVSNLVVDRDGYNIKADWRVPPEMVDKDNKYAAKWIDIYMDFNMAGKRKQSARVDVGRAEGGKAITFKDADQFWIRGQQTGDSVIKNFDRTRYHPCTWTKKDSKGKVVSTYNNIGTYCTGVTVQVFGGITNLDSSGVKVKSTYKFYVPRKPTVTWKYENGDAKLTVETDPGDDQYERYDTMYRVWVTKYSQTKGKYVDMAVNAGFNMAWRSSKSTKISHTFDLKDFVGSNLLDGNYVKVTCEAYARGMAGDSAHVTEVLTVARPSKATIGTITGSKVVGATIKVPVTPGKNTETVELFRKVGDGSWTAVEGAVDDKQCNALYDTYGGQACAPEPGQHVWYQVKSMHSGYAVYSAAAEAAKLFTEKAAPACTVGSIAVDSVAPGADGTSAKLSLSWTDTTANEGTELSWAKTTTAWSSTDGASTAEFPGNAKNLTISSLEVGAKYFTRIRRYRTVDGQKLYSKYSALASFTTSSAENDQCRVDSHSPSADGSACEVVIAIKEDSANVGTEVTWATYEDAWQSNEQPQSLEADWATSTVPDEGGFTKRQTVHLRGLEPGTQYYVKARRYAASGPRKPWSDIPAYAFSTAPLAGNADLQCALLSVEGGADGGSAAVVVGWSGDRTSTEVSWSTDPDAWQSSVRPSTDSFDWSDAERKSEDWAHTGTFYLHDLEQGSTYYVRARTALEGAAGTAYSDYSETVAVTPIAAPESVSLTVPSYVARGEAVELWWTVQSDLEQAEWHVHEQDSPNASLADGEGTLCHATIPPERYGDAASLAVYVEAGCGGALTASGTSTVAIVDAPPCEAWVEPMLAAQPLEFEAYTDGTCSRLLCTVLSQGCSLDAPDGARDQLEGDVVWTGAITPELSETTWGETALRAGLQKAEQDALAASEAAAAAVEAMDPEDDGYEIAVNEASAAAARYDAAHAAYEAHCAAHGEDDEVFSVTVSVPLCDLYDGGSYTVRVAAAEPVANLASEPAEARFSVAYAHQAPDPVASAEVDEGERSVRIDLERGELAEDGDVYDVYRMTPSGYELAASGVEPGTVVEDRYAPFGGDAMAYRVCTRTVDGDITSRELAYEMDVHVLRFDWEGGSVELPYNLDAHDTYRKAFEARSHVDGTVSGYYDRAVTATGDYSASVLVGGDDLRLLNELAMHPGSVFCRKPNGEAFQCNVDVQIGQEVGDVASVDLEVTRVALTDEFSISSPRGEEEPENG